MFTEAAARKELARRLKGSRLGCRLRFLEEATSTNDVALAWCREGAPEGALVIASAQTRGRGRLGRSWHSPPGGGFWFSFVLRPDLDRPEMGMLPVTVGAGMVLALRSLGLPAALKWPNDVLVGRRKVAGILLEAEWHQGRLVAAAAGVGVNWSSPDLPELAGRAAGLEAELAARGPGPPQPAEVLATLLGGIEQAYLVLVSRGPGPLVSLWPELSAHFARLVEVARADGGDSLRGVALGLGPDGSQEILLPGGERERVNSGELSLKLV